MHLLPGLVRVKRPHIGALYAPCPGKRAVLALEHAKGLCPLSQRSVFGANRCCRREHVKFVVHAEANDIAWKVRV
jgi:hypothetical protein